MSELYYFYYYQDNRLNGPLKIYIKNMVDIRCQMVVKSELERLGIQYTYIHIGELNTIEEIPGDKLDQLDIALRKS